MASPHFLICYQRRIQSVWRPIEEINRHEWRCVCSLLIGSSFYLSFLPHFTNHLPYRTLGGNNPGSKLTEKWRKSLGRQTNKKYALWFSLFPRRSLLWLWLVSSRLLVFWGNRLPELLWVARLPSKVPEEVNTNNKHLVALQLVPITHLDCWARRKWAYRLPSPRRIRRSVITHAAEWL